MADVPNVPGVPALDSFSVDTFVLLVEDLVGAFLGEGPQWGIFLNGFPVIEADSTIDVEFKEDLPISSYQIEAGGFATYNKVKMPTQIRVRVAAGGSQENRQAFLTSIAQNINTVDLYDVVTPEETYVGYNFTHRDFTRRAKAGMGLITVDLWLEEVRETSPSTFSNTQSPAVAGQQGNGNVQPQTPNQQVDQSFQSGSWTVQ